MTDMLNRRGFERDLVSRCSASSHTGRRFAIATITLSAPDRAATTDVRARSEPTVARLAALWRHDAPAAATWARIGDVEFAVLWDDTTGFDDYLELVRCRAAPMHPVSIGASDSQRGHTPIQMLAAATNGVRVQRAPRRQPRHPRRTPSFPWLSRVGSSTRSATGSCAGPARTLLPGATAPLTARAAVR